MIFRCNCINQRILRRKNHIGNSKQCIRTCCEDGYCLIVSFNLKANFCAFTSSNPVFLHQLRLLWPIEIIQIIDQFLCVLGRLPKPLIESFLCHFRSTSLTTSIFHLFVRQDCLIFGAPVHIRFLLICKIVLVHLQEQPLCPTVIFRCAGIYHLAPVVHRTNATELLDHRFNVRSNRLCRRNACFNRIVFCRKPECIKAHWREDRLSSHPHVTRKAVRRCEVVPVSHMQLVSTWVRKHHHAVILIFGLGFFQIDLIGFRLGPFLLPLGFDR